jgi:hypothetical protein
MTEIDSNKVIEKLTEVLDLLKSKKEVVKEAIKDESFKETVKEQVLEKEPKKCPLRKTMTEEEFTKIARNTKVCKNEDCGNCPFLKKTETETETSNYDLSEEFEIPTLYQEQSNRESFQVINSILSLVLLVLFSVFLFRIIKGFYCII